MLDSFDHGRPCARMTGQAGSSFLQKQESMGGREAVRLLLPTASASQ